MLHDGRIVVRGTISALSDATDELLYHAPARLVDDVDLDGFAVLK